MEEINNIENIKAELENSLIWNLSCSSLEDFHTCFWKWLGNTYPASFLQCFTRNQYSENAKITFKNQVTEENSRLDLRIEIEDNNDTHFIIIENKLKSFPNIEQLRKYNELKKYQGNSDFILVSLANMINLPSEWKQMSYLDLAQNIAEIFAEHFSYNEDWHKNIINDYRKCINLLHNIVDYSNDTTYEYGNSQKIRDISEKCQELTVIYKKIKADEFAAFLESKKTEIFDKEIEIASYFQSGYGCTRLTIKNADKYILQISLQGNKYRREFIFDENCNKEVLINYFNDCSDKYSNFEWIKLNSDEQNCTTMTKSTCQFMGGFDKYTWFDILKYFNDYSYENIWNKIKEDIEAINFEKIDNQINNIVTNS